jgi:hypothetical protein
VVVALVVALTFLAEFVVREFVVRVVVVVEVVATVGLSQQGFRRGFFA